MTSSKKEKACNKIEPDNARLANYQVCHDWKNPQFITIGQFWGHFT